MADTDLYWNPILETLPQDKLRELQLKKLVLCAKFTIKDGVGV